MTPEHTINEQAARDFYGPAVYTAPRVVDVGEHKLEAWQLRAPADPSDRAADAPARTGRRSPVATPVIRDRRPFGRKPIRKGYAIRSGPTPAALFPRPPKPDPDRYVAPSPDDWRYSNRWAS